MHLGHKFVIGLHLEQLFSFSLQDGSEFTIIVNYIKNITLIVLDILV